MEVTREARETSQSRPGNEGYLVNLEHMCSEVQAYNNDMKGCRNEAIARGEVAMDYPSAVQVLLHQTNLTTTVAQPEWSTHHAAG